MPDATLTLLFTQRVGACDRIISLLRRRGFPISGITLERTHRPEIGRMTVAVTEPQAVAQVSRHLSRLPDVVEVMSADEDVVRREYALVRLRCSPEEQPEVLSLLSSFDARVLSTNEEHLLVEAAGRSDELDALFTELSLHGIEESARTSPISMKLREEKR